MPDIELTQIILNAAGLFLTFVGKQVLSYIKEQKKIAQEQREQDKLYKEGIVCLLRYHCIKSAQLACRKNSISVSHRADLKLMYETYHDLGGNGIVTEWYERAMKLPVIEDL